MSIDKKLAYVQMATDFYQLLSAPIFYQGKTLEIRVKGFKDDFLASAEMIFDMEGKALDPFAEKVYAFIHQFPNNPTSLKGPRFCLSGGKETSLKKKMFSIQLDIEKFLTGREVSFENTLERENNWGYMVTATYLSFLRLLLATEFNPCSIPTMKKYKRTLNDLSSRLTKSRKNSRIESLLKNIIFFTYFCPDRILDLEFQTGPQNEHIEFPINMREEMGIIYQSLGQYYERERAQRRIRPSASLLFIKRLFLKRSRPSAPKEHSSQAA